MLQFNTIIEKFDKQGEKTGWTYIVIRQEQANVLNPGVRTTFRVKGMLDDFAISKTAILPMGDGSFIMPLNATVRRGIRKAKGATVSVSLALDAEPVQIDNDFMDCLQDEPQALLYFQSLTRGHRNYFSKWIESAKTETTKAKRIAMAVNALARGLGYPEMLRAQKAAKKDISL